MRSQSSLQNSLSRFLTIAAAAAIAFALMPIGGASAAYTFRTLHSFCAKTNCLDGMQPWNRLMMDQAQNLYGTTAYGGKYNAGVVFRLVPNADKSAYKAYALHSFCKLPYCRDGAYPVSDVIVDVDGNLYGTAYEGNESNRGVIFKLTPGTRWTLTALWDFSGGDGEFPTTGLSYAGQDSGAAWDKSSPLFGTTSKGAKYGNGVAYEL